MTVTDNALVHYGVKGMKWENTKTPATVSKQRENPADVKGAAIYAKAMADRKAADVKGAAVYANALKNAKEQDVRDALGYVNAIAEKEGEEKAKEVKKALGYLHEIAEKKKAAKANEVVKALGYINALGRAKKDPSAERKALGYIHAINQKKAAEKAVEVKKALEYVSAISQKNKARVPVGKPPPPSATHSAPLTEVLDDYLMHYGIPGMRWGVRKDRGHEGQRATTKKIDRLDARFEKKAGTHRTYMKLDAATKDAKKNIAAVNARYGNKPAHSMSKRDYDNYYNEISKALETAINDKAHNLGTNASGTRRYEVKRSGAPRNDWWVETVAVTHADTPLEPPPFTIKMVYAPDGVKIIDVEFLEIVEHDDMLGTSVDDFLVHYGIPGMRWGQRKAASKGDIGEGGKSDAAPTSRRQDFNWNGGATGSLTTAGKRGAAKVKDAAVSATSGSKREAKKMSDAELQAAVRRLNMERQYSSLSKTRDEAATNFVKDIGTTAVKGVLAAAAAKGTKKVFDALVYAATTKG
jgi:hypothetical protein